MITESRRVEGAAAVTAPVTNPIETAFARLTHEWRRLSDIKLSPSAGAQGFDDLVTAGRAEVKREPITRGGIACGERTFFRLKP